MSRITYYYQTFSGLGQILVPNTPVTNIHLSSIHFGNEDNKPYIHLNDNDPYDLIFDKVWDEVEQASKLGIKIVLMIGGAGGGYSTLFSDFETYFGLLNKLLNDKPFISGIDIDIEETVELNNVKLLINRIKKDHKDYIISMTPIQSSLETDTPGLGGFIYKDLLNSSEGKHITYFNTQFYSDYSLEKYEEVINNGYDPKMIVMGTMDSSVNIDDIVKKYGQNFGGVYFWEYKFVEPDPLTWAKKMKNSMTISIFSILYSYIFG